MNFEKIVQPIEEENNLEQAKEISRRLRMLQYEYVLEYTDKEGGTFLDNLEKLLKLKERLSVEYKRRKKIRKSNKEMSEKLNNEIDQEIEKVFEVLKNIEEKKDFNWKEQIDIAVEEMPDEWGPKPKEEKAEMNKFNSVYHYVYDLGNHDKELMTEMREENDIKDDEHMMEIHFDSLFKSDGQKVGKETYKQILEEFKNLAINIKNENPDVRAIFGKSWLMGKESLVKRIGFKTTNEEVGIDDFALWYQFLNQEGQINEQRVKQFKDTGELPIKGKVAYMLTEDFLQKYLPDEEKQSPITLKRIKPEWIKNRDKVNKQMNEIEDNWENIKVEDIETEIKKRDLILEILEGADTLDDFVNVFKKIKKAGLAWHEGLEMEKEEVNRIGGIIKEYHAKNKFKEIKLDLRDEINRNK